MKIATVSSYVNTKEININLFNYLKELNKYFDKVILLTNHRTINSKDITRLQQISNLELFFVPNEWADFGMVFNYLQDNDIKADEWLFTNDSVNIIKPLDDVFKWINKTEKQVYGITDAYTWNPMQDYTNWWHIQSYFLYFKWEKIINHIKEYIKANWIYKNFTDVIVRYEFWISRMIKSNNWDYDVLVKSDNIMKLYKLYRYDDRKIIKWHEKKVFKSDWEFNLSFMYYDLALKHWSPFLKKSHHKYNMTDLTLDIQLYLTNELYKLNNNNE